MKVKPEHIERLRVIVSPFMNKDTAQVYKDAGLSEMRYRWDALWSARRHNLPLEDALISEIYQYANDDHIDTVLRMIAKEREDVEATPPP